MPNPNIHYKEINELLKVLDIENERVEKLINPHRERLLKLNLNDNGLGIDKNNIKSILLTLEKYKIFKIEVKIDDEYAYFMKMGYNEKIVSIINHHYNFNLKSYENEIKEPVLIARCSNKIALLSAIFTLIGIAKGCSDEASFKSQIKDTNNRIDSLITVSKKPKIDTLRQKNTLREKRK